MRNGHLVVDADGHVIEPWDVWERFLAPEFRGVAPKVSRQYPGVAEPNGPGPRWRNSETGKAYGAKMVRHYGSLGVTEQGIPASVQLEAMDEEGIDAMVLYPTRGLAITAHEQMDGRLSSALSRAYNRWLFDFCSADPTRLVPIACVGLHSPDLAAQEVVFAVEQLGARGVMIRPNPYMGRNLDDPAYDVFYAEVARLGVPLATHEACGTSMPSYGDRFADRHIAWHAMCHPMEQMGALLSFTIGGVLERHPDLKVILLEAGATWLPYWLYRLDEHVDWLKDEEANHLTKLPSEYFDRQGLITVEADEPNISALVDAVGIEHLLWASDYPHPDATFPGALDKVFEAPQLSDDQRRLILSDNPISAYGLDAAAIWKARLSHAEAG